MLLCKVYKGGVSGAGTVYELYPAYVLGRASVGRTAAENKRLVAARFHIDAEHFKLLVVQQLRRKGRDRAGFQLDVEDIVVIRYLYGVAVALAVRPRFGAVAYLHFLGQREGVLHIKDTLDFCLCALRGVALQKRGQIGR